MEAKGLYSSVLDYFKHDTNLINQFFDYTIPRDLWRGIEVLLSSGGFELQIFDLSSQANSLK